MKRKTVYLITVVLILFSLISCDAIEIYQERKITFPTISGYILSGVGTIDKNSIILIFENDTDRSVKQIYRYYIKKMAKELIYQGEGKGSNRTIQIRPHPNGTYSIQFENYSTLIFNKESNQLMKTIDISKVQGTFFNLSNDGEKIVYVNNNGICISDLDFNDETVIYKAGEQPYFWPAFSNDDSRIAFVISKPPDDLTASRKCVIYHLETGESVMFDCKPTALFWLKRGDGLIILNDGTFVDSIEEGAHIWYYDLDGHEINSLQIEGIISPIGATEDYMVYRSGMPTSTYNGLIMLWNPESDVLKQVDSYKEQGVPQCASSGNELLFDYYTKSASGGYAETVLWVDLDVEQRYRPHYETGSRIEVRLNHI